MTSNRHKKVYTALKYSEQFHILDSVGTGCISISDFTSLVGTPIAITSSAVRTKICAITAGIKK